MGAGTLLLWLLLIGLLAGLAHLMRKSGYLPLRHWEVAAFGFGDIQQKAARQVAAAQVAYESANEMVEALCKSRLQLFRQVKRYVYELEGEWQKLDRDPTVPAEWKEDIRYIYETCYQEMIAGMPSPYKRGEADRRSAGGGQGEYKEGEAV